MSKQKGETEPKLNMTSAGGAATKPAKNTTKPKAKGGRPRKASNAGLHAIRNVDLKNSGHCREDRAACR